MGRVLIKFKDNHIESFKCKSKERAKEVAEKRPNVKEWNYYEQNDRIPIPKKKKKMSNELTMEQMEQLIKRL